MELSLAGQLDALAVWRRGLDRATERGHVDGGDPLVGQALGLQRRGFDRGVHALTPVVTMVTVELVVAMLVSAFMSYLLFSIVGVLGRRKTRRVLAFMSSSIA